MGRINVGGAGLKFEEVASGTVSLTNGNSTFTVTLSSQSDYQELIVLTGVDAASTNDVGDERLCVTGYMSDATTLTLTRGSTATTTTATAWYQVLRVKNARNIVYGNDSKTVTTYAKPSNTTVSGINDYTNTVVFVNYNYNGNNEHVAGGIKAYLSDNTTLVYDGVNISASSRTVNTRYWIVESR